MTLTPEMITGLKKPFTGKQVGKLPRVWCPSCRNPKEQCQYHGRKFCKDCNAKMPEGHLHLDYVGHAHVTERLWEVDPEWMWEPFAIGQNGLPLLDENYGLWIKLTIGGQTRIGYGHAGTKRGGDAIKEIIGDAIRNAAMRFQVALTLWKKDGGEEPLSEEESPPALSREELLRQIEVLGKSKRRTLALLADDFAAWCKGQHDLMKTMDTQVLTEFRDHLQGTSS